RSRPHAAGSRSNRTTGHALQRAVGVRASDSLSFACRRRSVPGELLPALSRTTGVPEPVADCPVGFRCPIARTAGAIASHAARIRGATRSGQQSCRVPMGVSETAPLTCVLATCAGPGNAPVTEWVILPELTVEDVCAAL